MISTYRVRVTVYCDGAECYRWLSDVGPFTVRRQARAKGWALGVKKNGEPAKRGGKDYCPQHAPGRAR